MSLLSVIQDHCKLHALNVPSGVIGSTDTTVVQLFAVLNDVLEDLVTESKFNVTTQEATFTSTASEDQGALSTLAPSGYQWIIPNTIYDRTLGRPVYGPVSEADWQALKALPNPGPFYKYRIKNDRFLMNPTPTSPFSTIAFEYMSSWCVTDSGGTLKAALTDDTDLFVFPEAILKLGLAFRWKQINGLPYQADETAYYNRLNNYISRDKVPTSIYADRTSTPGIQPGIYIPSGNWFS